MAKLKDILKLVNEQINSNELSALVSASDPNEVDISDEGFEEIKSQIEGLLTVESAQTNREVKKALFKQHEKTIKTAIEEQLEPIAKKLEAIEGYSSAKTVEEKIDLLKDSLESFSEKAAKSTDKDTISKYKKDIADLNEQISKLTEEKETAVNETKSQYEQKLEKKAFVNYLANNYQLADPYQKPEIKNALFNKAYEEAKKSATLKLKDDDSFEVFDPETPDKPLYIKNKPAGIDDIVSPIFQEYIKVSNGSQTQDAPKLGQQTRQEPKPFEPGTLADQMSRQRKEYLSEMGASS